MTLKVSREKCRGCEACLAICPSGAIRMKDYRAVIDDELCLQCGACLTECPWQAILRTVKTETEKEREE